MASIFATKRGPSTNLSNLPVVDGSFIVTTDDHKLYVDLGSSRYSLGDVLTVDALPEAASANPSKFYFLPSDNCFYRVVEGEFINVSRTGVTVETGATNGTIKVNGTEVAVFGLGEAAFMDANDIATKYYEVGSEVELNTIEGAKQGDVAVVKVSIAAATETSPERFEYTGYVYDDGTWKAMDGNYSAENVYFREDITLAGSYTSVGNVSKGSNTKTGTLKAANKSLKDVMTSIFTKELNPGTPTQPAVTLTFDQAGEYEVGESVSPSYSASLSAGSYTYGPATGITATGWTVTDTNGGSSTEAKGSFSAFTVGDDTNYTITAEASHDAGKKAQTNLGTETSTQIAAGSKSKTSSAVTGYRKTFHGSAVTPVELTSANIRKMTGVNSATTAFDVTVVEGATQVVIAVPQDLELKSVADTVAYGTDIVSKFVKSVIGVEGANSYTAKNYNVYVYSPDTGLGANKYEVTVG